jgi:hypothetical protein
MESTLTSPKFRALILLALAALVLVPSLWLIHVLGIANGALVDALHRGASLAEGPIRIPAPPLSVAPAASAESTAKTPDAAHVAVRPEPEWPGATSQAMKQILLAHRVANTDPIRSRRLLQSALELEPNNERALRLLSSKMLIDEKLSAAHALSERCLQINSSNYGCRKVRELAPPNAPELTAARRLLETCLEKEPNSRECLNGMAALSFMAADLEAAKSFGDRLSRAAPEAAVTMLTQGRLKAAAGSYAAARVLFEAACALERHTDACFRAEILRAEGY